jgi:hypothetical protein
LQLLGYEKRFHTAWVSLSGRDVCFALQQTDLAERQLEVRKGAHQRTVGVQPTSMLALPNGFITFDALAAPDSLYDRLLLFLAIALASRRAN